MAELLLELFSEEIPARFQAQGAEDLKRIFTEKLTAAGLAFNKAEAHVTPRRLVLVVDGLPVEQPARKEEKKGPKLDAPQAAIDGFLKSAGLTSLDQCEQRDTPKGKIWVALTDVPGKATKDTLVTLINDTIRDFPWKKSMTWGEGALRWVRPLHAIVVVFDGKLVNGAFEISNPPSREGAYPTSTKIEFTDHTQGHRFLAKGSSFQVTSFADYKAKLQDSAVILDREERKRTINDEATAILSKRGLQLKDDTGLLEEVAGLVEWPVALLGRIDDQFMDIPPEVLTTTMRVNQRYFAALTPEGKLAPYFVIMANTAASDGGKTIIAGNERVLRARLSDARFFWDQDRKHPLSHYVGELSKITFHAKLGTMAEKAERMAKIVAQLAGSMNGLPKEQAVEAARLAKADLVTGMVGEFPELQGIMGAYYAGHSNQRPAVVQAIREHYSPLGPNDACPSAPVSVAVALADKLDTLVGFFGIEELPTGSKDPYALRRAALGIIRLILENGLRLNLADLVATAHAGYEAGKLKPVDFVQSHLLAFFSDRLKTNLKDKGVRHDLLGAVLGARQSRFDLAAELAKLKVLEAEVKSEEGKALLALYRRATNILKIEEKKDGKTYTGQLDAALLIEAPERELASTIVTTLPAVTDALTREDFSGAIKALNGLSPTMNAFFENVIVNADKPLLRENRLRLLAQIRDTLHRFADFSQIEGEEK